MKDAFIVTLLSLVPRNRGARLMGRFASLGLSRWLTRLFVKVYGVNLDEASLELSEYRSLEDLFTRELKPGVRPIDSSAEVLVSPVDGTVAYFGSTRNQILPIGNGQTLDVQALTDKATNHEHDVIVLYLSPTNYHRVHTPREGVPVEWRYVPGTLWPVFPAAVRRVKGLFSKNERAIVEFKTDVGPMQVVLVGAFGVGRITLSVCDLITNSGGTRSSGLVENGAEFQRGEELGIFHLGSTVILTSPKGTWDWTVSEAQPVRLGEPIGRIVNLKS